MRLRLPALLLLSATLASAQEIVPNFSFEATAPAPWASVNSPTSATLDFTAAGQVAGTKALRVTTRGTHTDGARQNIIAALPASPNPAGEPFRVRLRINTDDIAFVRCQLQFVYFNAATSTNLRASPIILAEKIVRKPGQWVEIEGVKNIVWPVGWANPPNRAWLSVEVGQLYKESLIVLPTPANPNPTPIPLAAPPGVWPAYTLDFVSIEADADLDGLSDSEEVALIPPSDPALADSDFDQLPDKWEKDHQLAWTDPLDGIGVLTAARDPDGDGFTNYEEYWAATDPRDEESFPGKTADPAATAATQQMARYLALIPSRPTRQILIGQMCSDPTGLAGGQSSQNYAAVIQALADKVQVATGAPRYPAMLATAAESVTNAMVLPIHGPVLRDYATQGGLVVVKWAMFNPWGGGSSYQGAVGQVDIPGLVDPASPTYTVAANVTARGVLNGWLDTVADELAKFVDPAAGGHPDNVVIFRPVSEMNGNWFWWGHRTRHEYDLLWRHLFTYLTTTKQLHHLLWCYESAQSEHYYSSPAGTVAASDYYYPGDDVVDIMSHNLYDDDWVLPHDFNALYRTYPKIYGVPQAGPGKNPGLRDGSFSNLVYLDRIEAAYPRMSFFVAWDTFNNNGTINHLSIVDNLDAIDLMTDPRAVTRETFAWMTPFQAWAREKFGTLDIAAEGDSDADGASELLEYATGGDPSVPDAAAFAPVFSAADPAAPGYLTLTLIRDPAAVGVSIVGETTGDLADAAGWGGAITLVDTAAMLKVRDTIPMSAASARFLRLRLAVP